MISDILRNFNLTVDGRGHAGKCEEVNPPKLSTKTEEVRLAGMDAPVEVDMGMEKIEMDFTLASRDAENAKLMGLAPGNLKQLTLRSALVSEDGSSSSEVIYVTGMIKSVEPGAFKPGEKATTKYTVAARYYKHVKDGATIHEIDVENMVRIVNGVDQLAAMRRALGI